jgi:endoglucanase
MRSRKLTWPLNCGFASACLAIFVLSACSNGSEGSNNGEVGGSRIGNGGSTGTATSNGGAAKTQGTSSSSTNSSSVGGTAAKTSASTSGQNAAGGANGTDSSGRGGASSNGSSSTNGSSAGGKSGGSSSASAVTTAGGKASGGSSSSGGKTTGGANSSGGKAAGGSSSSGASPAGGTNTNSENPAGGSSSTGTASKGGASAVGGTSAAAGSTGSAVCVAATAVANMKLGWNLGNSLDSVDASKSDTTVETAWGNPVITSSLIQAVASAGFGAVRIPVTWIGRCGSSPDYTISAAYINRVEEVINYVLKQNLYAIINIHHDGGNNVTGRWLTLVDSSGKVTTDHTTAVVTQFKKMWTQIADHFKDYDGHLIFESMNEVMVDYDTPQQSFYDVINQLNQAFVDTVRASGGNNPGRCLVVPGYNTNIDYTVAGFVSPKDTSSGKLILSDHYYDPYSFTGSAETHAWGTGNSGIDSWGQEDSVKTEIGKLKSTFIDKGLPVILGEYGAVNQSGYEKYRRYYVEYVTKAAHDAGIAPFIWDNGSTSSGSDAFGLINRSNNTVQYPTIMEAIVRATTSNYALSDVAKP